MALIAMAVYCTEENKKDDCFRKCLLSVLETVDLKKHRLFLCVNGATETTDKLLNWAMGLPHKQIIILRNGENIGTARAINKAWAFRGEWENCIKMDDDCVINQPGWVDEMDAAITRDPLAGQVGLKRKDCWEWPGHDGLDWRSELAMLPHTPGEPWIIVEKVKHVIGTCVMHSAALLDAVGVLYQPTLYGYDDVIMSHRCHIAGFYSCFLSHINIDHVDPGDTPYQDWKQKHSGEQTQIVIDLVHAMYRNEKPIFYDQY